MPEITVAIESCLKAGVRSAVQEELLFMIGTFQTRYKGFVGKSSLAEPAETIDGKGHDETVSRHGQNQ